MLWKLLGIIFKKLEVRVLRRPCAPDDHIHSLNVTFVPEMSGSAEQVQGFRAKVTRKSDGRHDTNFYNTEGRRFRSMIDVGRFFNLVAENKPAASKKVIGKKKPSNNRDCENEKKRLRRELDKLLKNHRKATKALDDFQNERKESRYPVDDDILMEEDTSNKQHGPSVTPTCCPAVRVPDINGFPGVPSHCIPDLIMTWDFLCTFGRAISVNPIELDDFAAALTYTPQTPGEDLDPSTHFPPVVLAETHLGLLKLLLQDQSSDDWWWSILETDEAQEDDAVDAGAVPVDNRIPLIKVDMAALLDFDEDPLVTASWLQSLEEVRNYHASASEPIKRAAKTARGVVANVWVKAYLKKAMSGNSPGFTKRAVLWLVDRMREARPDLWERSVSTEKILQQKTKVIEEVAALMDKMHDAEAFVSVDDIEGESDDDMDSDDSDDDDDAGETENFELTRPGNEVKDENVLSVTSAIPTKPPPSYVDLLLPPSKPLPGSDLVSPFTWPALTGAAVCRLLHRYKRLRNEVDDSLRAFNQLPAMTVAERHRREELVASRVLTECTVGEDNESPSERAAMHLCSGGSYLELSTVERLCMLRILIEAAYDTRRVYEVVDGNYKARIGAVKALEIEERRAKREAKEELAAAEKAARLKLASEAKAKFIEEKRREIEESNRLSNEYTDDFIDCLTEEDIVEFDQETKAEFEAIPRPENFNKTEVNKMVARMQEEAAFNTHSLTVLTLEEIEARERKECEEMEKRLRSFGDVGAFEMDRETTKAIDRLKRNIEEAKDLEASLPELRQAAEEALKDAMQDSTIKALRAAIRLSKQAKLTGQDDETGGIWALDLLRDAALELKSAEGRKRVVEAQKDLVAKRNKCFIRTEPLGRDRFRNRFWQFDGDESGHVWIEADYLPKNLLNDHAPESIAGYVDILSDSSALAIGAEETEEDLVKANRSSEEISEFLHFCRQEYHKSGVLSTLAKRHWGCHTTEKSWRALIKNLDERGSRECQLKINLKEALEESRLSSSGEKDQAVENGKRKEAECQKNGDEHVFLAAKHSVNAGESSIISLDLLDGLSSAMGQKVRIREVIDATKEHDISHYNVAVVDGWKMAEVEDDEIDEGTDPDSAGSHSKKLSTVPLWRASLDRGGEVWLSALEVMDSLCRYIRWSRKDKSYFEDDAAFLMYRNSLGRHSGKAADAAISSTPMFLARLMVKREQELYTPFRHCSYDNNWGGKSGARNAWITSMKDFCFDLGTVRDGLLTLENAFFELTGGIPEESSDPKPDGRSLLNDEAARFDIELESMNKSLNGLWNSRESREIFHELVKCKFCVHIFDVLHMMLYSPKYSL